MILVLLSLLGGCLHGIFLRSRKQAHSLDFFEHVLMPSLYSFLFCVGITVGHSAEVMSKLNVIGLDAITLALSGIIGSLLLAPVAKMLVLRNQILKTQITDASFLPLKGLRHQLRGVRTSLLLLGCFGLGLWISAYNIFNIEIIGQLSRLVLPSLYLLLWSAGATIGGSPSILSSIRLAPPIVLIIPACVIVGTLTGTALVSELFLKVPANQAMGVGAGMGYYSLSCAMLTTKVDPSMGFLALLVNLAREVITIGLAPLIVRFFGPFGLLSVGATTTCSSSLPMVHLCAGKGFVLLGIINGVILTIAVPLLIMMLV